MGSYHSWMSVCQTDESISTSGIGIHTKQYLLIASHHSVAHNTLGVRTLMSRAGAPSSNGVECVAKMKTIVETLKEDGYPHTVIHPQALTLEGPA